MEESLEALFADLEARADGLYLAERDAELADLSSGEYAEVTLASRLHACVGTTLVLTVAGVGRLQGRLLRVGSDWCLMALVSSGQEWVVRLAAVEAVRGASDAAVNERARSVLARLGLRSTLREMAQSGMPIVVWQRDGTQSRGLPMRVGADFVEMVEIAAEGGGPSVLLSFDAIAAVTG